MRSSPAPFTFFATAGTIARSGARPLFCDIDPATFNLSAAAVETFISQNCVERDGSTDSLCARAIECVR